MDPVRKLCKRDLFTGITGTHRMSEESPRRAISAFFQRGSIYREPELMQNNGLELPTPLIVPVLDPAFRPAVLATRNLRATLGASERGLPIRIALEQADGSVFHYATRVFAEDTAGAAGKM